MKRFLVNLSVLALFVCASHQKSLSGIDLNTENELVDRKSNHLPERKDTFNKVIDDDELDDLSEMENSELAELASVTTAIKVQETGKQTSSDQEMGKTFVYELLEEEKADAIQNAFETTALKAVMLKSKLDMKIDETVLMLQNLKNLKNHIESAYKFANRFVSSKVADDEIKQYVVSQLENSIQQVQQTLDFKANSGSGKLTVKQ